MVGTATTRCGSRSASRAGIELFVNPIVRLASGVSKEAAQSQLDAFYRRLAKENPSAFPAQGFTTLLSNYLDVTVASGDMRTSLRLLLGAVAFLLLIACANVANLQLARATARGREMAVRASIGAGRKRLVRQLLTESVVLSLIGGVAGVLFAFGAVNTIVALMPEFYVPNEARVSINTPVLVFSVVVSVLTGILFGLVPALQSSRPDVVGALKAGRGAGEGTQGGRTRNVLVVAEVALAVVLLVSAGLMVRTFLVLQQLDLGMQARNVLMINVPLPAAKFTTLEQRNVFAQQFLERVAALPGVEAASIGNGGAPFGGPASPFTIVGQPGAEQRRLTLNLVGPDHLRTFGISLRSGRMFDASEVLRGDRVTVINEAAARLWPAGESPIGTRVRLGVLERTPPGVLADSQRAPELTIIGIFGNTRNAGLRDEPNATALVPYSVIAPLQRTLSGTDGGSARPPREHAACAGSRDRSRTAAGSPDHAGRGARPASRPTALHDGAVQCLCARSAWCSPRPASTACCRSMLPGERRNSASAWRSAHPRLTCWA